VRIAGDYAELPWASVGAPSLRSAAAAHPRPYEADAVRYLNGGTLLVAAPAVAYDVLEEERILLGSTGLLTDGEWLWSTHLAHYLSRYHVELDPDFLVHARARAWRPGQPTEVQLDRLIEEVLLHPPA
jgi:hypothetical protein